MSKQPQVYQNLVEAATESPTLTTLTMWETISSNLNISKTTLFTVVEAFLTDCPENHVYFARCLAHGKRSIHGLRLMKIQLKILTARIFTHVFY